MSTFKTKKEAEKEASKYINRQGLYVSIRKVYYGKTRPVYKLIIGYYGPKRKPQKEIKYL